MKGSVSATETPVPGGKGTAPSWHPAGPARHGGVPGLCGAAGRGRMIHGLPPAAQGPAPPARGANAAGASPALQPGRDPAAAGMSRRLGAARSPDGPGAPRGCDKFLTSQTICTSAALGRAGDVALAVTRDVLWLCWAQGALPALDTSAGNVFSGKKPNSLTSGFSLLFEYFTIKHFVFKSHSFSFLHLLSFQLSLPPPPVFPLSAPFLRGTGMCERSWG